MRIVMLGQQKFGKAALEAFLERGHTVAAVFCAPAAGAPPDPLKTAAQSRGIAVHELRSLKTQEARDIMQGLEADLGIMAYVLQFAPEEFTRIPAHGTIQYHPSLLPRYRGPSSINWPIIRGDTRTGLTIFRPTDGLDEGPVILQKETPVGPDDTLGSVYFDRLFPMGVAALVEAAELVVDGKAVETSQDESSASYEGWCRSSEAFVHWHQHVDAIYDLIRGCDPAPGAWTACLGGKLQLFDVRKKAARRFSQTFGEVGAITDISESSMSVRAHGGEISVARVRFNEGEKLSAVKFCNANGLARGFRFGSTVL